MALLLDTNVTSELRRSGRPECAPAFRSWVASTDLSQAFVSVITVHEMTRGVLLSERKDAQTGRVYRNWLEVVLDAFRGRILDLTLDAVTVAATYHVPDPAPLADAFIAGIAAVNGLTVVTRNVDDFERFGVPVLNPWEPVQDST